MGDMDFLLRACREGDLKQVKELVSQKERACFFGDINVCIDVSPLIESEKAQKQKDFNLALVEACRAGHLDVVEFMISSGARDVEGGLKTACQGLLEACRAGHVYVVDFMLSNGALNFYEGLIVACESGHLELVKKMMEREPVVLLDDQSTTRRNEIMYAYARAMLRETNMQVFYLPISLKMPTYFAMLGACAKGHVNIVEFFLSFQLHDLNLFGMKIAWKKKHAKVVKLIMLQGVGRFSFSFRECQDLLNFWIYQSPEFFPLLSKETWDDREYQRIMSYFQKHIQVKETKCALIESLLKTTMAQDVIKFVLFPFVRY